MRNEIYHTTWLDAALGGLPRRAMTNEQREVPDIELLFEEVRKVRRVAVAMTVFAAACVLIGLGVLVGGKRETDALAELNAELTKRVNKLTAEVSLKDARFQASKALVEQTGRLKDLLTIQRVLDDYARDELHNGNTVGKTGDEVRREACDRLAAEGYPCLP